MKPKPAKPKAPRLSDTAKRWRFVALVLVTLVYVSVMGWLLIPRGSSIQVDGQLDLRGRPTLGSESAPVEIILFLDFQCPHCRAFDRDILPRLRRAYIDTGRVRITLLHYPVMSDNSYAAALAVECAYQQSEAAFWTYKTTVFALQRPFGNWATHASLVAQARSVPGLDAEVLVNCLQAGSSEDEVLADKRLAERLGVNATPTVLVNGRQVAPTYELIKDALEQ